MNVPKGFEWQVNDRDNPAGRSNEMTEEHEHTYVQPLCKVSFRKSSSKDGGMGFDIEVSAGCSDLEADTTYATAERLTLRAYDATDPARKLTRQLEESVA